MNTTNITKLTLPIIETVSLKSQRAIKKALQRERIHRAQSSVSRWPANTKNEENTTNVTTTFKSFYNADNTMKTLNNRKLILVALGFFGVVVLGVTLINTEGLNVAGEVVGYLAGLAILGLAALDNTRTKRFT